MSAPRKELLWRADLGDGDGSAKKKERREKKKEKKKGDEDNGNGSASSGSGKGKLPEHLEKMRTKVSLGIDCPTHTTTFASATAFATSGFDNSFDLKKFKENFSFHIESISEEEMVFDVIGIDTPIANALRRILLSEVPTIAFEHIYIRNNTSVIVDEVLAHRVGLLPLQVDPRPFQFQMKGEPPSDTNTVEFTLEVSCPKNEKERRVYSGDFVWHPLGTQVEDFAENPIKMVHDDILLAILGPGQEINLIARAVKGVGMDHVKFSPVATAFYRTLPEVVIRDEFLDDEADALVNKCPMKVFDIEDMGTKRAVVSRPRNCTVCRECLRPAGWSDRIELLRNKTHYIFTIESTGALAPELIFHLAMQLFLEKLLYIKKSFNALQKQ